MKLFPLNEEQITLTPLSTGVLFQMMCILSSMIQVKLMNLITSFTSFPTIVIRLIAIQVLRNYFQLQLSYNVQCNIYMGFAAMLITA